MLQQEGYNRLARKLIHFGGGLCALLIPFMPGWLLLLAASLGVALAFWLRPDRSPLVMAITKPQDRALNSIGGLRSYFITVFILIAAALLMQRAGEPQALQYAVLGWLALAWGDGLAGMLGPGPSVARTVPWNSRKTWLGVLGCFIGVFSAFLLAFSWPAQQPGPSLAVLLLPALICAVLTALAESMQTRIDDNYFTGLLPAGLAFAWFGLLAAP